MNTKIIEVEKYEDIPDEIQNEVSRALTDDILERFDNSIYHNEDIIHSILGQYGYKLKD